MILTFSREKGSAWQCWDGKTAGSFGLAVPTHNSSLLLPVPEARSSRSNCKHGQVLVRALFLVHSQRLLAVSLQGGSSQGSLWGLNYKALMPFMRAPPSRPKAPPPSAIVFGH